MLVVVMDGWMKLGRTAATAAMSACQEITILTNTHFFYAVFSPGFRQPSCPLYFSSSFDLQSVKGQGLFQHGSGFARKCWE